MRRVIPLFAACVFLIDIPTVLAQDRPDRSGKLSGFTSTGPGVLSHSHVGTSPFAPPDPDDQTFVIDEASDLDTDCTFRNGGPLEFSIRVGRVLGNVDELKRLGLVPEFLSLEMPAYDVDFDAVIPGYNPERDRVYFNGNPVQEVFLTGENDVWKLNAFRIPID